MIMLKNIIINHIKLIEKIYSSQIYLNDYKKFLVNEYQFIAKKKFIRLFHEEAGQLKGQILIIPNKNVVSFGFIDFDNEDTFDYLWSKLLDTCYNNNIKNIIGPINGSTWHHYRVISSIGDNKLQAFEPWSLDFYHKKLEANKPIKTYKYFSAWRSNFNSIILKTKAHFDNLKNDGFTLNKISQVSHQDLKNIYDITVKSFKNANSFNIIKFSDFKNIYKNLNKTKFEIYFVKFNNKPVAFVYCHYNKNEYFIKTLAVIPKWQSKGIAKSLIAACHLSARKMKYKKINYALIRQDSPLNNLPLDNLNIYRQYKLYSFNI